MAVSASGLFYPTISKSWGATTAIALNLLATSHKIALFNNSITPNFSSNTAYGTTPFDANEVTTATYWPAGGVTVATAATGSTDMVPTLSDSPAGTLMWDFTNDLSVASTTLNAAVCALIYADALANEAIVLIYFGGPYSTSNGVFGIQWAATGCVTVDYTP